LVSLEPLLVCSYIFAKSLISSSRMPKTVPTWIGVP
jgi:hypothetical protein